MVLTKFTQGDAFPLPVIIRQKDAVITPANASEVRIYVGGFVAHYPNGTLTYSDDDGAWIFPLSQTKSYNIGSGYVDFQAQVKLLGGITIGSKTEKVAVNKSVLTGAWESGNADEQMARSGGEYVGGELLSAALAPINVEIANQLIVITSGVTSVNGQTGDVVLTAEDIGAASEEYVQDAVKTISVVVEEISGGGKETFYVRNGATWGEFANTCNLVSVARDFETDAITEVASAFFIQGGHVFTRRQTMIDSSFTEYYLFHDNGQEEQVKSTDTISDGDTVYWYTD